jgi:hypothetical protein
MKDHVTVDEWVAMFREIGLDEAKMHRWHQIFEVRHPDAHQAFLEWLGLSLEDIAQARAEFR